MSETKSQAAARYANALHAMQSGVKFEDHPNDRDPKHIRTGINARAADQGGLVALLIAKGLFTEEEYITAVADSMEHEVKRYEAVLSQKFGKPVTLG